MEAREPGFCEKNGYRFEKFEGNAATKWGHAFESAVIELAETATGYKIRNREKLYTADNLEYITCHIDGQYAHDELHEGKTTSAHYFYSNFGEPGSDRVPLEYQVQCQHELICTGAEKVILSVLVFPKRVEEWEAEGVEIILEPDGEYLILTKNISEHPIRWAQVLYDMGYFHQYTIHPDAELQQMMLEKYSLFWNENILGGKMPDVANTSDIKKIYTEPKGTVIATEQVERWNAERKQLMSEKKDIDKRIEQLKTLEQNYMRVSDSVVDEETREKTFLMSREGRKLASYDGRTMR